MQIDIPIEGRRGSLLRGLLLPVPSGMRSPWESTAGRDPETTVRSAAGLGHPGPERGSWPAPASSSVAVPATVCMVAAISTLDVSLWLSCAVGGAFAGACAAEATAVRRSRCCPRPDGLRALQVPETLPDGTSTPNGTGPVRRWGLAGSVRCRLGRWRGRGWRAGEGAWRGCGGGVAEWPGGYGAGGMLAFMRKRFWGSYAALRRASSAVLLRAAHGLDHAVLLVEVEHVDVDARPGPRGQVGDDLAGAGDVVRVPGGVVPAHGEVQPEQVAAVGEGGVGFGDVADGAAEADDLDLALHLHVLLPERVELVDGVVGQVGDVRLLGVVAVAVLELDVDEPLHARPRTGARWWP